MNGHLQTTTLKLALRPTASTRWITVTDSIHRKYENTWNGTANLWSQALSYLCLTIWRMHKSEHRYFEDVENIHTHSLSLLNDAVPSL